MIMLRDELHLSENFELIQHTDLILSTTSYSLLENHFKKLNLKKRKWRLIISRYEKKATVYNY